MNATYDATDIRNATLAKIEILLNKANAGRRARTLAMKEVIEIISNAVNLAPIYYDDAGTVANAYRQPAITTFALATKVDGRFYLGIGTASAKGVVTPGRAWKCLQPFGETGPKGNAEAKWAEWIKQEEVIELADPEIDALLETGVI